MSFHLRSGHDFYFLVLGRQKSRYTASRMTRDFPPVLIPQCYVSALKFKTYASYTNRKRQHTFGGSQPCPLADIPILNLPAYLFFNLQHYFLRFLNFSFAYSYASLINGFNFSKVCSEGFNTHIHAIHAYTGCGSILSNAVKS